MSKSNLEKEMKKEIGFLNDAIDRKIIRGLSYRNEARRHKFLLSNLARVRRSRGGLFRTFGSLSTYVI